MNWSERDINSTPDGWQSKEFDNRDVSITGGEVPAEAFAEAIEGIPAAAAEVKVTEPAIIQSMPGMPILLDDAGAVIKCFYHPEADAVNLCSRCGHYVCAQCNYVTGTHPICRNCWEKRGQVPIPAAPVKKQEGPKLAKSEKPGESSVLAEPAIPAIPAMSAIPDVPAISAIPVTPAIPTTPAIPAIPDVPVQKQETPKLAKSDRRKMEDDEHSRQFMRLYEQALPFINAVVTKSTEGLPASPLDLMEGLKLRPMLKHAKKLPKPRDKGLQEAKKTFEQLLAACAKVGETAADFVSAGGQTIPTEANYARLADGVEKATVLMGQLSRKLPPPSQPQV